jgi:hypothetical protein
LNATESLAIHHRTSAPFAPDGLRTELALGARKLRPWFPALRALRIRTGQADDYTTDPQYLIAAQTKTLRSAAAVLLHRNGELEACVLFSEYSRLGFGIGIYHGGNFAGDGLVVGPSQFRAHYVHLATQALLRHWRIYGVSLCVPAPAEQCLAILGPPGPHHLLAGRNVRRTLPLAQTYAAMLAAFGPRTRRSLATKRQQLQARENLQFQPSLHAEQAYAAMRQLRARMVLRRNTPSIHTRRQLLRDLPDFFAMGICLPNGTWLSLVSGWRRNGITYIDFQMNDRHHKKESLSAVMRAFLLEHEISLGQSAIHFVGGTSLLLRRYCPQLEPVTDILRWRPCLRATLARWVITHLMSATIHERITSGTWDQTADGSPAEHPALQAASR